MSAYYCLAFVSYCLLLSLIVSGDSFNANVALTNQQNFVLNIAPGENSITQFGIRSDSFVQDTVLVAISCDTDGVVIGSRYTLTLSKSSNGYTSFSLDLSKVVSVSNVYMLINDARTSLQTVKIVRSNVQVPPVTSSSSTLATSVTATSSTASMITATKASTNSVTPIATSSRSTMVSSRPSTLVASTSTAATSRVSTAASTRSTLVSIRPSSSVASTSTATITLVSTTTKVSSISTSMIRTTPIVSTSTAPPSTTVTPASSFNSPTYSNLPPGTDQDIYAIVGILDWGEFTNPAKSVDEVKTWLFNSSNSVPNNLQNAYSQCTYGKVTFNPDNVFVYRLNLTNSGGSVLPYSNIGLSYNISSGCGLATQMASQYAIRGYAFQNFANDPILQRIKAQSTYHTVVIMPQGTPCTMYGVGSQNCNGICNVNVMNRYGQFFANTAFHEIGHNLGLNHASTPTYEYGDCNDIMGCASSVSGVTCFNAANSYRMGWSDPIVTLSNQSFVGGNTLAFTIPAMRISSNNHLIINANSTQYFVSYKSQSNNSFGYDSELDAGSNRVEIHLYQGGRDQSSYYRTFLQAALKVGESWTVAEPSGKTFTVQLVSTALDQTSASVTVKYV